MCQRKDIFRCKLKTHTPCFTGLTIFPVVSRVASLPLFPALHIVDRTASWTSWGDYRKKKNTQEGENGENRKNKNCVPIVAIG